MGSDFVPVEPETPAPVLDASAESEAPAAGSPFSFTQVMSERGPGQLSSNHIIPALGSNVIDMNRWLPRSDMVNTGLTFAATENREQSTVVAQLTDRMSKELETTREVQIRPTGDARRDAQQIQDAITAAATRRERVTIAVSPGIYKGNIVFPPGAQNIHLKGLEVNGQRPTFDMAGMGTGDGRRAVFTLKDNRGITIEGFDICNYRSQNVDNPPAGIIVSGSSKDINVRNNKIHHLGWDSSGRADRTGSQPILVLGTGTGEDTAITNININNNFLNEINLGQHEGIAVNGNVNGFSVSINRLTNLTNIGIDVIGGEGTSRNRALDGARNGLIRGNFISGIDTDKNPTYPKGDRSAGGIYIDGARDVRIETNVVENTNRGIEVGCEHAGYKAQNISVTNNWLRRNHLAAITVGAGSAGEGATDNVHVINNIFQANGPDGKLGIVQQHNVTNLRQSGNRFVDPFWIPK